MIESRTRARSRTRLLAVATAGLALLGGCGGEATDAGEGSSGQALPDAGGSHLSPEQAAFELAQRSDPRVQLLLQPCQKDHYYDRDTGDPVAILLDRLQNGQTEVLHRAKEELAELGELALPEVVRLLNRYFDAEVGSAHVQNSIEVLGLMRSPGAHDSLIKCLDHPRDVVRGATLRALAAGAAQPADFERLLAHLPVEREHMRQTAGQALFVADPERAVTTYLDWFESGANQDLWPYVVTRMLEVDPEPYQERALALYGELGADVGLTLAAMALGTGEPGPRALIDEFLASEHAVQRLPAVSVLLGAGRELELVELASSDPDPTVRSIVLQVLTRLPEPPEDLLDILHAGLDDGSPEVRAISLGGLLARQDPTGIDRAIAMLLGSRSQVQEVILILMPHVAAQPELAERCFEALVEADRPRDHLPISERKATLQAIGQMPLAEAAAYLRKAGLVPGERIQGLTPHRWAMIQAVNTGQPGRAHLMGELRDERDPVRRLDLLWAASGQREDQSRDFLLDFVQSQPSTYELLFAAERLVQLGPTAKVAPVLKRVTLDVRENDARRALQCLLWRWY